MKHNSTGKRRTIILWLLLWCGVVTTAASQEQTISGTVTAVDTHEPLPGVSVVVKGTTIGTVTDVEGRYSLSIPGEANVVVFSYVGYINQEVTVGNQAVIAIALEPDVMALEEVVVVGYGVQKKASVTAS